MVKSELKDPEEIRGRIMQFSKKERDFFKKHNYNMTSWIHSIISKAIILKEQKNMSADDILEEAIRK